MDTPALAAAWIILMAVVAFGAALGGTTWVYFADKRRPHTPRRKAEDVVDALTPDSPTSEESNVGPKRERKEALSGSGERDQDRLAA